MLSLPLSTATLSEMPNARMASATGIYTLRLLDSGGHIPAHQTPRVPTGGVDDGSRNVSGNLRAAGRLLRFELLGEVPLG
jgi:hypothetical protein